MAHSSFTSERDFADAFDRYADDLFRHCYLRVLERERAKRLMTDAFARVWQFIAEGNVVDSMQLLLYRMAHHLIRDEHERAVTETPAEISASDESELDLLREVTPEQRCVLVLHYVDGFPLEDIGEINGAAAQENAEVLREGHGLLSSLLTARA